jgi:hypothetical protein
MPFGARGRGGLGSGRGGGRGAPRGGGRGGGRGVYLLVTFLVHEILLLISRIIALVAP